MKTYSLQLADERLITYQDRKRHLWLLSMLYPLLALSGVGLYLVTASEWLLLTPLVSIYGGATLFDWLLGTDKSNPPEELVPQLEEDPYYRWLPMLTVPLHVVVLVVIAGFTATHDLSWLSVLVLALTAGLYSGLAINTAHELGHKKTDLERRMARVAAGISLYGHFCIEHNRGHHRHVATPDDPASSRMGENIYGFALREIPGAFKRGWTLEKERLERLGKSQWSLENEALQSYAFGAVLQISLIAAFGWIMLPFLVVHNFFAWWQLTSANYIEHYGLLRQQKANGTYEHCQPYHSWNADFIASNLLLYHLERHSDHHAHPTRRYQSLRSFPDLPSMPTGYFGMFLIALIPSLWYLLMDRRVLALPHIAGDFDKINIAAGQRAALEAKYGSALHTEQKAA